MKKLFLALVTLVPSLSFANPRALPFTYTTDTLAPGEAEIEQTVDLIPLRATDGNTGLPTSYLASQFQTELEIGLCHNLELALYFVMTPAQQSLLNTARLPESNGIKQRIRYILADPGEWPIDVGLYGELSENDRELELEGKILLQKRFGKLRVAANLWAEYEFYFAKDIDGNHQRDVVLNPTAGATYEVTPKFHIGIDSWLRGEYPTNPSPPTRTFGLGPEYYIGPAAMMAFKKVWWTVAVYARVTDTGHDVQQAEPFGKVWFRTMVGYDL